MSVNYYAHAIIGCEVPVDKLYKVVVIKHTKHEYPKGAAFCPICGERTERWESESIFDEEDNKLGQFDIIWSTDRKKAFIGCHITSNNINMVELPNIEALRHELAETLSIFGTDLWNSDTFGLWSVLYCSY